MRERWRTPRRARTRSGPISSPRAVGCLLVTTFVTNRQVGEIAKNGGEAVVKAAQKAKDFDANHVGVGNAYQTAPELGIAATASKAAVSAKPLVAKAKTAGRSLAVKWEGFDERNRVTVCCGQTDTTDSHPSNTS